MWVKDKFSIIIQITIADIEKFINCITTRNLKKEKMSKKCVYNQIFQYVYSISEINRLTFIQAVSKKFTTKFMTAI